MFHCVLLHLPRIFDGFLHAEMTLRIDGPWQLGLVRCNG